MPPLGWITWPWIQDARGDARKLTTCATSCASTGSTASTASSPTAASPAPTGGTKHNALDDATNQALQPHAGGVIEAWSDATPGEIRDDQGISLHNPDTDVFMSYTLAGAYSREDLTRKGNRFAEYDWFQFDKDRAFALLDTMREIAAANGCSPPSPGATIGSSPMWSGASTAGRWSGCSACSRASRCWCCR